ncbi:MAG: asparaginase domain-containing protein [Acidimicrobiales bacterium]
MSTTPFWASGAIPPGEALYVLRPADSVYRQAILAGNDCHLLGSRQSGKTSLVNHAIGDFLAAGRRVAFVDLSAAVRHHDATFQSWHVDVIREIARQLGYTDLERLGVANPQGMSFLAVLRSLACAEPSGFVLILDEFDSLRRYPFADSVVQALRALQQDRSREPDLRRLTLSICAVRTPAEMLGGDGRTDVAPLAGDFIWLDDFELDDGSFRAFSGGLAPAVGERYECARDILRYCGGFPQASTWLGRLVNRHAEHGRLRWSVDFPNQLPALLGRELGRGIVAEVLPTATHLDSQWLDVIAAYILESPVSAISSLQVYDRVLSGPQPFDSRQESHQLLRWSGICRVDTRGLLRPRCELFEWYFDHPWVATKEQHLRTRTQVTRRTAERHRSTKRLCVLSTGGTVGMIEQRGRVASPLDPGALEHFQALNELADSEVIDLLRLDSADVGPDGWVTIARRIKQLEDEFDGFIVAHGTDTMAYTASAVAFALGPELSFPVVFTGSQTTIDIKHGDAVTNLLRAGLVALEDIPEVMICFGEYAFRAVRTQKKDDRRFDAFESPGYPPLGYVAEDVQILVRNLRRPPGNRDAGDRRPSIPLRATFSTGILHVAQTPGSHAAFYEAALAAADADGNPLCRGVVIQSLGAGNVPSLDERYALTRLISAAQSQEIPVVITSQYPVHPANLTRYSPVQAAVRAGGIPTGNLTIPAVITKFSWVLGQVDEEMARGEVAPGARVAKVRQMMGPEYVGEGGLFVIEGEGSAAPTGR